jgi:hypothetical protein
LGRGGSEVQIKEAKIKFDAGCFKQACITDALMSQGYNLTLIGKKQADNAVLSSQRASEEAKAFKSYDAAIKAAKDIGFQDVTVRLSRLR